MKTRSKKRVTLGGSLIASIGVVAIIAVGMTLGLYGTSQASTGNSFAVLAGTNSLPGTCTSAGNQCLAGSGFAWS